MKFIDIELVNAPTSSLTLIHEDGYEESVEITNLLQFDLLVETMTTLFINATTFTIFSEEPDTVIGMRLESEYAPSEFCDLQLNISTGAKYRLPSALETLLYDYSKATTYTP